MFTRSLLLALSALLGHASATCLQCDFQAAEIKAVLPGDTDYQSYITPQNLRFVYQPAAFTFPSTPQQVAQVVQIAVKEGLHVVARSGGHSFISNSLGGRDGVIVVDLRELVDIQVDPTTFVAKVEAGNRLGSVALGLNDAGRAMPHGSCPDVGIGGQTSYGGSGYTNRQWGLALDAVESIDVVLGNGTFVHTSNTQYPDLFWAMRGAGGSYGITTAFYVKTYPVPPSVTYFTYRYSNLTAAQATHALATYQSFLLSGPPSTLGINFIVNTNRSPGHVATQIVGAFYGDSNGFAPIIKPLLDAFPTVQDDGKKPSASVQVGSYIDTMQLMAQYCGSQSLTNTTQPGVRDFEKSLMTPEKAPMSQKAIEALITYFATEGAAQTHGSGCVLEAYGGPNSYLNSIPLNSTAFAYRDTLLTFDCGLDDSDGTLTNEAGNQYLDNVLNSVIKNMPKNWQYGAYANYIDADLKDWRKLYYGVHYPKLQQIKLKYDPKDMFNAPLGIELPS